MNRCKLTPEERAERNRLSRDKYRLANKEKIKASYDKWLENHKDYHKNYIANLKQYKVRAIELENKLKEIIETS